MYAKHPPQRSVCYNHIEAVPIIFSDVPNSHQSQCPPLASTLGDSLITWLMYDMIGDQADVERK